MARLAPGPKSNTRAVKHDASSELTLAPVYAKHAGVLKERYHPLDGVRLALLANLFARIELSTTWPRCAAGHRAHQERRAVPHRARPAAVGSRADRIVCTRG